MIIASNFRSGQFWIRNLLFGYIIGHVYCFVKFESCGKFIAQDVFICKILRNLVLYVRRIIIFINTIYFLNKLFKFTRKFILTNIRVFGNQKVNQF